MKKIITLVLMGLLLLSLVGCGDTNNNAELTDLVQEYSAGLRNCDYLDSASFEAALNNGEKVSGKLVKFDVLEYKPDSGLGINCWSGEHLNFISDHELDVNSGDYVIAYISSEPKKALGSWKVTYDVIEIIKNEIEVVADTGTEPAAVVATDTDSIVSNDSKEPTEERNDVVTSTTEEEKQDTLTSDTNDKKDEGKKDKTVVEKDTSKEEKEPVVADEPEKPAAPEFTFADINEIRYADIDMNVRSLPNLSGDVVGKLVQNDEVKVTGKCNETGWYRIEYKGAEAFASNDHLKTEKVVVQAPVVVTPPTDQPTDPPAAEITYVLNTSSKKFHKPTCPSVKDIKASNRKDVTESRDDVIAKGYVACKRCYP